jgi:hypothetical protein
MKALQRYLNSTNLRMNALVVKKIGQLFAIGLNATHKYWFAGTHSLHENAQRILPVQIHIIK